MVTTFTGAMLINVVLLWKVDQWQVGLLQKSDFIPDVKQEVALGRTAGILTGLVAVALPATAPVIAVEILLASALAGAGVGAWLSGMVSVSAWNRKIKELESAFEAGEFLVLMMYERIR